MPGLSRLGRPWTCWSSYGRYPGFAGLRNRPFDSPSLWPPQPPPFPRVLSLRRPHVHPGVAFLGLGLRSLQLAYAGTVILQLKIRRMPRRFDGRGPGLSRARPEREAGKRKLAFSSAVQLLFETCFLALLDTIANSPANLRGIFALPVDRCLKHIGSKRTCRRRNIPSREHCLCTLGCLRGCILSWVWLYWGKRCL